MTDLSDLQMTADTTDLQQAKKDVVELGESTKKAAATSALYSKRLAGDYSLSASKIERANMAVMRMRARYAAQEQTTSRMVMSAGAGIRKMRETETRDEQRNTENLLRVKRNFNKYMISETAKQAAEEKKLATQQAKANREAYAESVRVMAANRGLRKAEADAISKAEAAAAAAATAERKRVSQVIAFKERMRTQREKEASAAKRAADAEVAASKRRADAEEKASARVSRAAYQESVAVMAARKKMRAAADKKAADIAAAPRRAQAAQLADLSMQVRFLSTQRRLAKETELAEGALRNMGRTGTLSFRSMLDGLSSFRGTMLSISGIIAGVGIVGLYNQLNKYTELTNTLKVLGYEGEAANKRLRDIQNVATQTRQPLDEMTKLYQKATMASKDLGANEEQILQFTKNIGLAMAQQGGATASAKGALLQLSQAIGMGNVKAEEFNSLMEGGYPVLVAAARGIEETGGSVMKLRMMMLSGELTSKKFFDAIMSQSANLEKIFAKTTPTMGQAMRVFMDSLMVSVGELDNVIGFSETMARGIQKISVGMVDFTRSLVENEGALQAVAAVMKTVALVAATMAARFAFAPLIAGAKALELSMYGLGRATGFAAAAFKRFLPTLILSAVASAVLEYRRMAKAAEEYKDAVKNTIPVLEEYKRARAMYNDSQSVGNTTAFIASTQELIGQLEEQKRLLEDQIPMWSSLFSQFARNSELDAVRQKLGAVEYNIRTLKTASAEASAQLKKMAEEAAAALPETSGMSDKAIQKTSEKLAEYKAQAELANMIAQYGEKSAEVEAHKRQEAEKTAVAFALQEGANKAVTEALVQGALAAFDAKKAQEASEEVVKRIGEKAKDVKDAYWDMHKAVTENSKKVAEMADEGNKNLRLTKLQVQYGNDHIYVVKERQRQEMISLGHQLDSVNASKELKDSIMSSYSVANGLSNAFGIMSGQISGADAAMSGLLSKLLAGLRAFQALLGGIQALSSFLPGPAGQGTGIMAGITKNVVGVFADAIPNAAQVQSAMHAVKQGYAGAVEKANDLHKAQEKAAKSGKKAGKDSKKGAEDAYQALMKELDAREALIGLSEEDAEKKRIAQEVTDKLTKSEMKYTKAQIQYAITRSQNVRKMEKDAEKAQQAVEGIADAFAEWMMSGFSDFKSFMSAVVDVFKSTLSDMIKTAIQNPIRIFVNAVSGQMGLGITSTDPLTRALQGAGTGATNPTGGLGGFLGNIGGGFGSGISSVFSGISSGFRSGGIFGGLQGGIGSAFSTISSGLGSGTLAGIASAFGAASVILGGVMAVIKIGKALFGRTLKDAGIEGAFNLAEGLIARTYKFYKGGLLRSDKTTKSDLDKQIANPIEKSLYSVADVVRKFAKTLGQDANLLDSLDFRFKFSTKGMDNDQIKKRLEEEIERFGEEAALKAVPGLDRLMKAGEGALEALERVSTALTTANAGLNKLGHSLFTASLAGAELAADLADKFGGISEMSGAMDNYFEMFYSDAEKRAYYDKLVREEFAKVGRTMPRTRAEYRAMIDSLDLTTESGRKAYAVLMSMAGVINDLIPAAEGLTVVLLESMNLVGKAMDEQTNYANQMINIHKQLASDWYAAAKEIRGVVYDLRYDKNTSQETAAYSAAKYRAAYDKALGGDLEAAQTVKEYAAKYAEQLLANSSSGAEYDRAIAKLMSELNLLSGVADLEGAKNDVLVTLYEKQIEVMESIKALLEAKTLSPEDIAKLSQPMQDALKDFDGTIQDFQSGLASIEEAIKSVGDMSYKDIVTQIDFEITSINSSKLPKEIKALLAGAADGIKAQVDFIVRSDLPPDLKFIAMTQQIEHIATVKFLSKNDMGEDLTRLAVKTISTLQKNIRFAVVGDLPDDVKRVLLATNSTLARNINVQLMSGSDPAAIRLGLERTLNKAIYLRTILDPNMPDSLRDILMTKGWINSTLTLRGGFVFDPSKSFTVWYGEQITRLVNPIMNLQTALNNLRVTNQKQLVLAQMLHKRDLVAARAASQLQKQDQWKDRIDSYESQLRAAQMKIMPTNPFSAAGGHTDERNSLDNRRFADWVSALNKAGYDTTKLTRTNYDWWIENIGRHQKTNATTDNINRLILAAQETLAAWLEKYTATQGILAGMDKDIQGFASGGSHSGGLRVVGEAGPEVEATGPSRVYTANQTKDMFGNGQVTNELVKLRQEVSQMREENNSGNSQIAKQSRKTSDTLQKWDYDGQPTERVEV